MDFAQSFLFELNKCRLNPEQYTYKVLAHMKFIKQDNTNTKFINYMYKRDGEANIMLNKGKEAFEKCIEILHNTQPLKPLELKSELTIKVPDDKELWTDIEFLKRKCNEKKEEYNTIQENAFHFDIGSSNPEVSLIMQLVDDTSFRGIRTSNLLSKEFKYIGIDNQMFDNISCSYFYLASNI